MATLTALEIEVAVVMVDDFEKAESESPCRSVETQDAVTESGKQQLMPKTSSHARLTTPVDA
jgi:hypothetical protein